MGCECKAYLYICRILNICCGGSTIGIGIIRLIFGDSNSKVPVVDYALNVYFV